MSENGKRGSYGRAFKVQAVRPATEGKRKVTEVARELGINANRLYRWKRKLAEEGEFAFPGKGRLTPEYIHDRIETAREFAQRHNVVLILKGSPTIVADYMTSRTMIAGDMIDCLGEVFAELNREPWRFPVNGCETLCAQPSFHDVRRYAAVETEANRLRDDNKPARTVLKL